MTGHEGANGFHLFTVVTDGYGGLISEDHRGYALARVDSTGHADDNPAPFIQLAKQTLLVLNGDAEPEDERARQM